MTAREDVLDRIRRALRDVPATESPESVPVPRDYRHASVESHEHLIEQFIDRLVDYKAAVRRVAPAELPAAIAAACQARGVRRLAVPSDLPSDWLPRDIEVIPDDGLSHEQLDAVDGVLTGCALAIAQTGTIVLDGGRRAGEARPDAPARLPPLRRSRRPGRRPRPRGRVSPRDATSTRPDDLDFRPFGHLRHRAQPRRGRPRAEDA